jgi:hypothetical protein
MAANVHPTSGELGIAAQDPRQAAAVLSHIHDCVACRIRFVRISRDLGFEPPGEDSVQRVLAASSLLPEGLGELIRAVRGGDPRPGEVWRVGRDDALLVWTRRVFDDGIADVVPLVLDVELADEDSILVPVESTPFAPGLVAMVALRTHIDLGAFINRIGELDLDKEVGEVMTAMREGRRPSGVRVGPPIEDDSDRRIEYRQAVRDFFGELTPDAWAERESAEVQLAVEPEGVDESSESLESIKERLRERVAGVEYHAVDNIPFPLNDRALARTVLEVSYLDSTVLVAMIEGGAYQAGESVTACRNMVRNKNYVSAVAIADPRTGWLTSLFTKTSLREAIVLPRGTSAGPYAVLAEHDLVNTLAKYFEAAATPWEEAEPIAKRTQRWDLQRVASAHAEVAVEEVRKSGRQAIQVAKKTTWQGVSADLPEQVVRFIDAVVNNRPVDDALGELGLEEDVR